MVQWFFFLSELTSKYHTWVLPSILNWPKIAEQSGNSYTLIIKNEDFR